MSLCSNVSYAAFRHRTSTQQSPLSQPERSLLTHPEGVCTKDWGLEALLAHTSAFGFLSSSRTLQPATKGLKNQYLGGGRRALSPTLLICPLVFFFS